PDSAAGCGADPRRARGGMRADAQGAADGRAGADGEPAGGARAAADAARHPDRQRLLVWQRPPRPEDGRRRDLRHERAHRGAPHAAAWHARAGHESRQRALDRGADQRPRPRDPRPHHRSLVCRCARAGRGGRRRLPRADRRRGMSMTLRSHLITLVLVAVLPLLLFSAIVVGLAADSERDATERGLRATGRAVSSAVDHTLDNAIGALEVLATSELLDGGDLPGFHKVAARALRGRALRGALLTALDAHDLARVLEAQQLPHQWAAAIVDGHGVVVARVPAPQRFVGQPATAAYVALTARGDSGAARMPGLDGVRRHTVFNRLENAGWTVYLAIPTVTMDAGFRRSLVTLIGG